ncbi:indole-3-glycerol phosphate synthase [Pontimonas salivibrio]|uniref:indole-3-glycerol-phosphate synthase n=1 Tax=Pontimonas salivibrio TaxID=1159327 RepID=A0A2L2BQU5_9MICO|nr:indole-3-glycerol phosphate synthase TrpC [Pontimonas salivibrio]AVG24045.1 indole-3-glycerol phosphate synthase [Pontimonas salivibrio]
MLNELVAGAREDARNREATVPLEELVAKATLMPAVSVSAHLAPGLDHVGVIAEIKRASPSKGPLADIPDPVWLAKEYEAGGASAISVLTESRQFKGSLDDLAQVSSAVDIPVLRKDFLTSTYQVVDARAHGASMILVIMAAVNDAVARSIIDEANTWGMQALVEAHSADEVRRAVDLGAELIGINARDLTTFELDRNLFGTLRDLIPSGVATVAESAVNTPADVAAYREQGADFVLVGEALVTGENPQATVREYCQS